MNAFVARQPIFDSDKKVFGYELLFRSGLDDFFSEIDGDKATSSVISDSYFNIGLETLTGGNPAFINFTRNTLLNEHALMLPKESLVVEVLETVEPDEEVIGAVRNLKENGYIIALDDFENFDLDNPLISLADIIKIDFMTTTTEQQRTIANKLRPKKIRLVAEKVETHDDFEKADEMGYDLFQGYFFCKPIIVQKARIPECKINNLRLLEAVHEPELDFSKVEAIVKHDVSFTYKLLRHINSAMFGLRREVSNIGQALAIMGPDKLRRWASLCIVSILGNDKPKELVVVAVTRARFCELLAEKIGFRERAGEMFLMGLFSTIDALSDTPVDRVLDDIHLSSDVIDALVGGPGLAREIMDVVIGYEIGNWELFDILNRFEGFDEECLPELHRKSLEMAEEFIKVDA